jgi:hypothetical protein
LFGSLLLFTFVSWFLFGYFHHCLLAADALTSPVSSHALLIDFVNDRGDLSLPPALDWRLRHSPCRDFVFAVIHQRAYFDADGQPCHLMASRPVAKKGPGPSGLFKTNAPAQDVQHDAQEFLLLLLDSWRVQDRGSFSRLDDRSQLSALVEKYFGYLMCDTLVCVK